MFDAQMKRAGACTNVSSSTSLFSAHVGVRISNVILSLVNKWGPVSCVGGFHFGLTGFVFRRENVKKNRPFCPTVRAHSGA